MFSLENVIRQPRVRPNLKSEGRESKVQAHLYWANKARRLLSHCASVRQANRGPAGVPESLSQNSLLWALLGPYPSQALCLGWRGCFFKLLNKIKSKMRWDGCSITEKQEISLQISEIAPGDRDLILKSKTKGGGGRLMMGKRVHFSTGEGAGLFPGSCCHPLLILSWALRSSPSHW